MKETPVKKPIHGHFLYSPATDRHFFRVYGETDPATGHKKFTDYRMLAEDIGVTLDSDDGLSLYEDPEDPEKNRLCWSARTLGKEQPDNTYGVYISYVDYPAAQTQEYFLAEHGRLTKADAEKIRDELQQKADADPRNKNSSSYPCYSIGKTR